MAAVAGGGVAGAALRWAAAEMISDGALPWSTLLVNVAGAFLLGVVIAVLRSPQPLSAGRHRACVAAASGFCGSLTTFSAWAVELAEFLTADAWGSTAAYLALTVGVGLAAAVLGMKVGQGRFS